MGNVPGWLGKLPRRAGNATDGVGDAPDAAGDGGNLILGVGNGVSAVGTANPDAGDAISDVGTAISDARDAISAVRSASSDARDASSDVGTANSDAGDGNSDAGDGISDDRNLISAAGNPVTDGGNCPGDAGEGATSATHGAGAAEKSKWTGGSDDISVRPYSSGTVGTDDNITNACQSELMRTFLHLVLVLLTGCSFAASDQSEAKHSGTAEQTAKRMRETILTEIKKLGAHDWAGDYFAGDGTGENTSVAVAPKAGFVFEWHGCLGLYDRNYGAVVWTNDRIRLTFTYENKRKGFQGIAPELIPVSWGSRRYLVPADDVIGFCNEVNTGSEPRKGLHGRYLLHRGDETKEVVGLPKVPPEAQANLLAKPVEATIIAVGSYTTRPSITDFRFKDTPVTLDAGADKGLRVGMKLLVTKPDNLVQSVRITKVEPSQSVAIMIQIGEDKPSPKSGWRLSTKAPWRTGR